MQIWKKKGTPMRPAWRKSCWGGLLGRHRWLTLVAFKTPEKHTKINWSHRDNGGLGTRAMPMKRMKPLKWISSQKHIHWMLNVGVTPCCFCQLLDGNRTQSTMQESQESQESWESQESRESPESWESQESWESWESWESQESLLISWPRYWTE